MKKLWLFLVFFFWFASCSSQHTALKGDVQDFKREIKEELSAELKNEIVDYLVSEGLLLPESANRIYWATALTGGAAGALDAIDGANLADLDAAIVVTLTHSYLYSLDDDLAATERSPDIITPDTNGGNKCWVLVTTTYYDTTTLTAAQVNALRATPITLVAAQGANTWIELVSAVITYDYGSAAFAVAADEDLVIEYADGTDTTASIETTGFLDQTDDEIRWYPSSLSAGADPEATINQALQIFNTGAGETATGTGCEVDVRIVYRVFTTGF